MCRGLDPSIVENTQVLTFGITVKPRAPPQQPTLAPRDLETIEEKAMEA